MKFVMAAEHKDALGRIISKGDVVVTLDANYRSGGSFEVGVVVGSTPKMVKVASPGWRVNATEPEVQTRHLDKILIIREEEIKSERAIKRLDRIRDLLASAGFDPFEI